MLGSNLEMILSKIECINPTHAAKVRKNLLLFTPEETMKANYFFEKYIAFLEREQKSIDLGVDCYLHMLDDMLEERMNFIRNGRYSNSSFAEVEKKVYSNPAVMTYHMHGLVLAQFLWYDQFERFLFFSNNLKKYTAKALNYLEIGGGHGLYLNEAVELLIAVKNFDLVDISNSSIELAKGIINNDLIHYHLKDIFEFDEKNQRYDFITIVELLEHLEEPLALLQKVFKLLTHTGFCYVTTPINAPMIDHIYHFADENQIRALLNTAGFQIIEEKISISDNETVAHAKKYLSPIMYAAFIKKN